MIEALIELNDGEGLIGSTAPATVEANAAAGAAAADLLDGTTAGSIVIKPVALVEDSGGANHLAVDAAAGSAFKHTLTKATTLDIPSNMVEGNRLQFTFVQAAGLYAVTFAAGYLWGAEGAVHTEWTDSGKAVIVNFVAISATQARIVGYQVNVG